MVKYSAGINGFQILNNGGASPAPVAPARAVPGQQWAQPPTAPQTWGTPAAPQQQWG